MNVIENRVREPLREEELAYLKGKKERQQTLFYSALRSLIILCILIPVLIGIIMKSLKVRVPEQGVLKEEASPAYYYFIGMTVLLILVAFGGYYSYVRTLKKLVMDLKEKTKIIEKTEVVRKQYMAVTKTYHFYIRSLTRLSIEVNAADFEKYRVGDEINIEYSSHAKEYFGYF